MEKLSRKDLFSLSIDAYYRRSSKEEYSAEDRIEGLRNYLADLNKDYRSNKNEIFSIIEETVDAILPTKVLEQVNKFAEVRNFDDNVTVKFKAKNGKIKAVDVAIGGTVERQRLDKGYFTVKTEAIQCKVYEEMERIRGGQVDWTELINAVIEAITEAILRKIFACLMSIYTKLPATNVHTSATFDPVEFDKIVNVVKAYGKPVIMGTPVALANITLTQYAEADKDDLRKQGYLGIYKGVDVVEIQNSFEDESNLVPVFDNNYIFVIPTGGERIVKVAMEGGLYTREKNGEDWSVEMEAYQKVGVSVFAINNIGMYKFA